MAKSMLIHKSESRQEKLNKFIPILMVLFVFIGTLPSVLAQEVIKSPLGFAMEKPKGWIVTNDEKMTESLKNVELTDEIVTGLLKSRNNSLQVMAFQKYQTDEREGPIPTIQARMRPNPIDTFDVFTAAFLRSIDPSKMPFENYLIVSKEEVLVSGYKAVKVISTYSLAGQSTRVRSYAVPVGKQYFQVTFIDNPPGEDCSAVFDSLVKSIKIERGTPKKT